MAHRDGQVLRLAQREAVRASWLSKRQHVVQGRTTFPLPEHTGPGDWPPRWRFNASRTRNQHFRDRSWLTAIAEPATMLAPQAMRQALPHRLHTLPICHAYADRHTAVGHRSTDSVTRARLPANRPASSVRQGVRVAGEAVGAEGQVGTQQWLVHTNARADDRHRLDVVINEATPNGTVLCCDTTLVYRHLCARGNHSHARPMSTAPPCGQ